MSKLPIHRAAAPKIADKITRGLDALPKVELLRPWRGYQKGYVLQPYGVLRQVLIQQGYAKMYEEKPRNPTRTRAKKQEQKQEKQEKVDD